VLKVKRIIGCTKMVSIRSPVAGLME
jgi:hypothetical protein